MVRNLTEEELCELAEIRNRLASLIFTSDERNGDVTINDWISLIYLQQMEIIDAIEGLYEVIVNADETE